MCAASSLKQRNTGFGSKQPEAELVTIQIVDLAERDIEQPGMRDRIGAGVNSGPMLCFRVVLLD